MLFQVADCRRTRISHSGFKTADELVNDLGDRSDVRSCALDTLGDILVLTHILLEVSVTGMTAGHRAKRSHAAILLVFSALNRDYATRSLVRSSKETAQHYAVGTCRNCLGNITAVSDTAVRDNRHIVARRNLGNRGDCRNLRHADSRDNPCSTD